MDPDVPHKLAGLFEGLAAVMAAVGEATAVDVFLVVSGTRSEGPAEEQQTLNKSVKYVRLRDHKSSTFIAQAYPGVTPTNLILA